ncbi:MAG: hypothetical protein KGI73_04215 [Patescibacteria group bacterium]|nr:hypothetical protein [Patescibacteria group bacterium]
MTFLRSDNKRTLADFFVIASGIGAVSGALLLIAAYNKVVALEHGTDALAVQTQSVEEANTSMRGQMLSLFDAGKIAQFASERGLVLDKTPQYVEIDPQWHFALEQ